MAQQIQQMQAQFQLAAPRGVEAAQLVRDALTCVRTIKKLDQAEPRSVLGALMTAAQLGLRPGVLGQCWPLPFWDARSRCLKAQLVIGYQGYVELAYRSGKVDSISARTVYANDPVFDVSYGVDDTIVHKPLINGDPGDPVAYYCVVKYLAGGHNFFVMGHRSMLDYRQDHASTKTKEGVVFGPWADNFEAMAHKTCLRQLAKWMPKSTELATAIEVDGAVRLDVTPDMPATEAAVHVEVGVVPDSTPPEGISLPQGPPAVDPDDPTTDPNWGQS